MTEQKLKSEPAAVSGQAGRISKKDAAIAAQPAALHMTIEITRAHTGKVEVFELIGTPIAEGDDQSVPKG